jgi:hypothetical protein
VKTNLVHILHRVKATGLQPLDTLKDLLKDDEYKKCKSSKMLGKTWFDLTIDVFVAFLFKIRDPLHFLHYFFIALQILTLVQCYLQCLT